MRTVSTVGLPNVGRTAAWNTLYSSHMSLVDFEPANQSTFAATLRIGELGPIKLAKLSVDSCKVERKKIHIDRSAHRHYTLVLQAKGSSRFHHCGNEARLMEGDFVLCDLGLPHLFETKEHSVTIMARTTLEVLREYLPTPEQFCGLQLGRTAGLAGTVAAMVRSLSDDIAADLRPDCEERVARYLLGMISMSYTAGFEPMLRGSAVQWRHRNAILRYIEDNLRDPSLTAASIAQGLRMSPRYVRNIFAVSGKKLPAYVLKRRLEECARQMLDPAWKGHTLTEIAFSWGFNSAAHFTRAFRDEFGVTPRDYRRQVH